jgi:hypothetical protein
MGVQRTDLVPTAHAPSGVMFASAIVKKITFFAGFLAIPEVDMNARDKQPRARGIRIESRKRSER